MENKETEEDEDAVNENTVENEENMKYELEEVLEIRENFTHRKNKGTFALIHWTGCKK